MNTATDHPAKIPMEAFRQLVRVVQFTLCVLVALALAALLMLAGILAPRAGAICAGAAMLWGAGMLAVTVWFRIAVSRRRRFLENLEREISR